MAEEASVGLMLWDRESVGTLMNVHRLVQRRKKVVVYVAPDREFVDLKAEPDWDRFVARCPDDLRTRIEKEAVGERNGDAGPRQARLL